MNTVPVDLIDTVFQAMVRTISHSAILSFGFLILVGFSAFVLRDVLRKQHRFDPTRHRERPPVEHKPERALPSAAQYVDWEKTQDAKDQVPWS